MKRFKNLPRVKRAAVLSAVSLIALTGLIAGRATPTASVAYGEEHSLLSENMLRAEVAAAESMPSETELHFLESLGALDEAALAEVFSAWKESFTYTESGGLNAKNDFCERFIDVEGNYGIYGKVVAAYLKEKLKKNRTTPMLADDLVGMENAPKICPNWREFDDAMRIKFWVWTFGAMASLEASCGADPRAIKGVRGVPVYSSKKDKKGNRVVSRYKIAIGLLQMEKAKSDRSWRGISTCNVSDSQIGETYHNLRCGMDIMEGLISANPPDKNAWPIYPGKGMNPTSYWLKLRAVNGGSIGELMRQFKPCRGKFVAESDKPAAPIPAPSATPSVISETAKQFIDNLFGRN